MAAHGTDQGGGAALGAHYSDNTSTANSPPNAASAVSQEESQATAVAAAAAANEAVSAVRELGGRLRGMQASVESVRLRTVLHDETIEALQHASRGQDRKVCVNYCLP